MNKRVLYITGGARVRKRRSRTGACSLMAGAGVEQGCGCPGGWEAAANKVAAGVDDAKSVDVIDEEPHTGGATVDDARRVRSSWFGHRRTRR